MTSTITDATPSPIVAVPTFINAIRDSGCKSTAAALAELVDNSLEAGAKQSRSRFALDKDQSCGRR